MINRKSKTLDTIHRDSSVSICRGSEFGIPVSKNLEGWIVCTLSCIVPNLSTSQSLMKNLETVCTSVTWKHQAPYEAPCCRSTRRISQPLDGPNAGLVVTGPSTLHVNSKFLNCDLKKPLGKKKLNLMEAGLGRTKPSYIRHAHREWISHIVEIHFNNNAKKIQNIAQL